MYSFPSYVEGSSIRLGKALIVDSDIRCVHELAVAMRQHGFVAFEATSYADAKRLWAMESPEVLVADVRLGQYNGLQLLLRARAERPGLAAVITCAFSDVVLEAETRRFGGVFLVKPLEPKQVLAAIGVHVKKVQEAERRGEDRRRLVIPNFSPERRMGSRRSNGHPSATA